jgi:hypothetical protein
MQNIIGRRWLETNQQKRILYVSLLFLEQRKPVSPLNHYFVLFRGGLIIGIRTVVII